MKHVKPTNNLFLRDTWLPDVCSIYVHVAYSSVFAGDNILFDKLVVILCLVFATNSNQLAMKLWEGKNAAIPIN